MIRTITQKLVEGEPVSLEEAAQAMRDMMSGRASAVETAAYLSALAAVGESIEQITGSARAMRDHATPVPHGLSDVFEIVGTGGDRSGSFNISTTASIVVAASGVKVAKHGNRAYTSSSGAADCLEALGVAIDLSPEAAVKLLHEVGICFLFAQRYHSAMKHVAGVRRELGIRTIFNLLGPLTNPASAHLQLLGVYRENLVEPLARVLDQLGIRRGLVVYGHDQLDELSLSAPSTICSFGDGLFETSQIAPEDVGLTRQPREAIRGGSPSDNARITRAVLSGERGAARDIVLFNAGAGLWVSEQVLDIASGVELAAELIDSGRALATLEQLIERSQAIAACEVAS